MHKIGELLQDIILWATIVTTDIKQTDEDASWCFVRGARNLLISFEKWVG
jgi:hypothetical protein